MNRTDWVFAARVEDDLFFYNFGMDSKIISWSRADGLTTYADIATDTTLSDFTAFDGQLYFTMQNAEDGDFDRDLFAITPGARAIEPVSDPHGMDSVETIERTDEGLLITGYADYHDFYVGDGPMAALIDADGDWTLLWPA